MYRTTTLKTYTADEQAALASKTTRKVSAFLHGAAHFEACHSTRLDDGATIESGTVVPAAQLVLGDRYDVVWDYQGEAGRDDMWKFRGGSEDTVRMMEEDMARDPNVGMPGNLLKMAETDCKWAQVFYDMAANYQAIGSVLQPHQPRVAYDSDDNDEIVDYYPRVVGKWNAIFARAKTNDHDMECMFSHCPQGCLAQEGACPFKHTPLHEHTFSGGNPYVMEESFGYYGYDF